MSVWMCSINDKILTANLYNYLSHFIASFEHNTSSSREIDLAHAGPEG